ncbi:MAG: hypothetical protein KGO49_06950 [Gammaproteobacteria bacterium]|nr:hypothetical protein [Gammaproteobacteria bacterium]
MALIKCDECGKEYSSQSEKCVNCGAPTPEDDLSYWLKIFQVLLGIIATIYILKACAPIIKPYIHFDGISESDLNCSSANLNDQMKSTFNGSQYALSNNLKAILAESQDAPKSSDTSLVTCQTKLTLNNQQTMTYLFDVTKNPSGGEDATYLISATPVDSQ